MRADMENEPHWKGYLYKLQNEAPKPMMVPCKYAVDRPGCYGNEYHGPISRDEGESLCCEEGNYLIRESQSEGGRFTLVLRVLGLVKNFKLYYEDGKHFVGDKRFDDIYSLAEDGLITMYVEGMAQDYIKRMATDPVYSSLSRYSSCNRRPKTNGVHSDVTNRWPNHCDVDSGGDYYVDYEQEEMKRATYQPGLNPNNSILQRLNGGGRYSNQGIQEGSWDEQYSYNSTATYDDSPMPDQELSPRKKHLTPTSSDERRYKKREVRSFDEAQPRDASPSLIHRHFDHARRPSGGSTGSVASSSSERRHQVNTPSPRRIKNDKLDANDNPLPPHQTAQRAESIFVTNKNASAMDQLRQFYRNADQKQQEICAANPNRGLHRSQTSVSNRPMSARPKNTPANSVHYRQRSEPVELLQNLSSPAYRSIAERSTPPLSEHEEFATFQDRIPREMFQPRDGATRTRKVNPYCGSGGSCDSSLSNVSNLSTGSSALPPQPEVTSKPLLDNISHVSSEEGIGDVDRGSTPSPESTNARRAMIEDIRFASNGYPGDEGHVVNNNRIHSSVSDHKLITSRSADENLSSENVYRRTKSEATFALHRSPTFHGRDAHKETGTKERHKSSGCADEQFPPNEVSAPHCHLTNKAAIRTAAARRDSFKQAQKSVGRSKSSPSPRKPKLHESLSSPTHCIARTTSSNRDVISYDKEHYFKVHTYRGLQWCEYCGNFMWGILQQGMQCKDCGLNVHKQCSKLVPSDCQPALKHIKHVFGIDLTTLVKLHGTERPVVVDCCITEIERRGLDFEGLYRVPGMHDHMQEIKLAFDRCGPNVDLSKYEDIETVASVLKLYLRELPVPLLPYTLYSRFINASKILEEKGKLHAIRMALNAMPPAHLQTLVYIVRHLGRVCENPHNQMDAHNLGIIFGPTILRAPEKDSHARFRLNDATYQQEIVATMIEFRNELFGSGLNTDV